MYESRRQHPLSKAAYYHRLANHAAVAMLLVGGSLLAGMAGYRYLEQMNWLDAFINAAMLLGGEGPLTAPGTVEGKLFTGLYALYSGVVFIAVAGLLLTPVGHRLLHKFHWEDK